MSLTVDQGLENTIISTGVRLYSHELGSIAMSKRPLITMMGLYLDAQYIEVSRGVIHLVQIAPWSIACWQRQSHVGKEQFTSLRVKD